MFGAGPAPAQGGPDQGGPRREPPRYFNGIDLNDPQQNPIYGHWDFYAIFSFIFALVSSFPVLPALIGCLAIGFLSAWFLLRSDIPLVLRTGVTVGVLGGLTTFSSFSLEVLRLLENGQHGLAVSYLLGSVLGGLGAAWLGMSLARL